MHQIFAKCESVPETRIGRPVQRDCVKMGEGRAGSEQIVGEGFEKMFVMICSERFASARQNEFKVEQLVRIPFLMQVEGKLSGSSFQADSKPAQGFEGFQER